MRLAQSEAFGKNLEQALVGGRRILDHCSVGLEQDIDGSDRVLSLSTQRLRMPEQHSQQADAQCRRDFRTCKHGDPSVACNGTAELRLSFIRPDWLRCYCP